MAKKTETVKFIFPKDTKFIKVGLKQVWVPRVEDKRILELENTQENHKLIEHIRAMVGVNDITGV